MITLLNTDDRETVYTSRVFHIALYHNVSTLIVRTAMHSNATEHFINRTQNFVLT